MADILIIDDDPEIRTLIGHYASEMGHFAAAAESINEGLDLSKLHKFDVIFLDVRLPDGNGLDNLTRFKQSASSPEVIIITGVGDAEGAELAINNGAWDYIQKPFSKQEILLHLLRALEFRERKTSADMVVLKRDNIVGSSTVLLNALNQVAQCSGSNTNVLLTGETGTGKELFARTIHDNSNRYDAPFVTIDCAALPETLVESILFGHVKGAFTGAGDNQDGLVKQADRGTLFLDEIGELPLQIQKNFLRLLQERRFRPVGSNKEVTSNFRLISATNRDLNDLVKKGQFRKDLLFRIRTFHIELPSLRKRPTDVKELMQHFIYHLCEKNNVRIKGYVPEFLELMTQYTWPGNVRELINTLEKAILADPDSPTLYPMHLPANIRIQYAQTSVDRKKKNMSEKQVTGSIDCICQEFRKYLGNEPSMKDFKERVIAETERMYLNHLMYKANNNMKEAIRISGLGQSRLYSLLRQHDISLKSE